MSYKQEPEEELLICHKAKEAYVSACLLQEGPLQEVLAMWSLGHHFVVKFD